MSDQNNKRVQCHFISNTHWDREWRYSAQRTRYMLVYLMDMLLDILDKEPGFKSFHLDSQTLPLQDYLEVRPEREESVRAHVRNGRLVVGPWFCLPDDFCVGGESLIRNLLLGHRIANRFGAAAKTGYSPFSWGQVSQMPQIYQGFGIPFAAFYRGINHRLAPRSEFWWEGADGTRIAGSRLGERPRYNIWNIVQRAVYWNMKDIDARDVNLDSSNGLFRFVDAQGSGADYRYTSPEYGYHAGNVGWSAERALREQDDDWSTPHRFWSCGHDSSCPDIREAQMVRDCTGHLLTDADVFFSTFEQFQKGVLAGAGNDWPILKGEMRNAASRKGAAPLLGWILSARTFMKQENFRAERDLISYTEPFAAFAAMLGAGYQRSLIDTAYNFLLQNHSHDSIGGCSRDVVDRDMLYRYEQCREICACLFEEACMDVVRSVDFSKLDSARSALVVFNPSPFARSEVIELDVDIPPDCASLELIDSERGAVDVQMMEGKRGITAVTTPNDMPNVVACRRQKVKALIPAIPGMGYRVLGIRDAAGPVAGRGTLLSGHSAMENSYLSVEIRSNGTLDVLHKETGTRYGDLGYFRDSSETGSPWKHEPVEHERIFDTLSADAEIRLIHDGPLETAFRVALPWKLPARRAEDGSRRSDALVPYAVVNTVTLRKGEPWVEIVTELENTAEDHYLQVCFPTGIAVESVHAQGQFDVVERSPFKPEGVEFLDNDPFQPEQPMNSFVDVSNGKQGMALLNEGLKGYELKREKSTLCLSLLRCFPLRICVTDEFIDYSGTDKGTQCPGCQVFRYAVMPHAGDWAAAGVWRAADRFTLPLRAAQAGPAGHGCEPMVGSFLEIEPDTLVLSAVKQSESGSGWVVRLFNPFEHEVAGRIRLNCGFAPPPRVQSPVERRQAEFALRRSDRAWSRVRLVTLEEKPDRDLDVGADGWIACSFGPKRIVTIEFLP